MIVRHVHREIGERSSQGESDTVANEIRIAWEQEL
jgi:hypothetical protein